MENALELYNISCAYHTKHSETYALQDVSLNIKCGEFAAIVGPSGCGKSTLLSIISGIVKADSGKVFFMGEETTGTLNKRVGYMLQKDHLFEWRTVLDNVMLGLEIQKKASEKKREAAMAYLHKYGLADFALAHPRELSGGMRQRVALIRTLVMKPELLLLDEPFSALDYQTRLNVCDDISSIIKDEHRTAILVTHDLAEAISVGDNVYVMSKRPGRIIASLPIIYSKKNLTPLEKRNEPEFNEYFNNIWKEMQKDD